MNNPFFSPGRDDTLAATNERNVTHCTVMNLLKGYEHKNHHIYMDNYYTSPSLFKEMVEKGFGACGTARVDRIGMPCEWKPAKGKKTKLSKGTVRAKMVNEKVLGIQWQDKRLITMLTTIHENQMVNKERRSRFGNNHEEDIAKPLCIEEYNKHMGGVDKSDQLLSYYGFIHKNLKWSNCAAFHLLDLAIVNSYILYKLSNQEKRHKTHADFRIDLATSLLLESGYQMLEDVDQSPTPNDRLHGRHFPSKVPTRPNGKQSQRECAVCSFKKGNKRKTTTYLCKDCCVPLCITPCFELYHTHRHPQRYLNVPEDN